MCVCVWGDMHVCLCMGRDLCVYEYGGDMCVYLSNIQ